MRAQALHAQQAKTLRGATGPMHCPAGQTLPCTAEQCAVRQAERSRSTQPTRAGSELTTLKRVSVWPLDICAAAIAR
jgi:hypothetical protein